MFWRLWGAGGTLLQKETAPSDSLQRFPKVTQDVFSGPGVVLFPARHICFLYGLALYGKESCTKSASGLWEDLVSSSTSSFWTEALHLTAGSVGCDLPVLWHHSFFKTLVLMTAISQINYSPKGFPRLGSHLHRPAACPKSSHYAFTGHMQQKFKTQTCLGFLSAQSARG